MSMGLGLSGLKLGASGGGGWTPSSLSDLLEWIDPTQSGLIVGNPVSAIASPAGGVPGYAAQLASSLPALTSNRLVFDGVINAMLQNYATSNYQDHVLADSGSGVISGKGPTCTGIILDPLDGTWWVGDHGAWITNSPTLIDPAIIHYSADFSTVLSRISMSTYGRGSMTVQGIALDTASNKIWIAQNDSTTTTSLLSINRDGSSPVTRTLTVGASGLTDFNGIAYDSLLDCLIVGDGNATSGHVGWFNKTTGALIKSRAVHGNWVDGLFFDGSEGGEGKLYVSGGTNAEGGWLAKYDVATNTPEKMWQMPTIKTPEHFAIVGSTVYMCNDAYFHVGGAETNRVTSFDINKASSAVGGRIVLAGVSKYSTPAATKTLWAGGQPTQPSGRGIGVFTSSTANIFRFIANPAGTTSALDWTVPGGTAAEFIWYLDANLAAGSCSLYINGTLVSTQSLTQTGTFGALAWTMAANFELTVMNRNMAVTHGGLLATLTTTDRDKIEGFLAWQTGNQALLPGGHAYKSARP